MSTCDKEIFTKGRPVLLVDTGEVGGAAIFDDWVKRVSDRMLAAGQVCTVPDIERVIDWHYSGGIAQVIVHASANFEAVKAYLSEWISENRLPLDPLRHPMRVIRWVAGEGLYRSGVTPTLDGAIGAFMDPLSGENVFI